MDKVFQIMNMVKGLSMEELERVAVSLRGMLGEPNGVHGVSEKQVEACRKCDAEQIVKFGKDKNGKQRYKCKCCGATFTATSFSTIYRTRHSDKVWETYIRLLLTGASLEVCACQCGISVRTAFIWRHKILNALQNDQHDRVLSGIIEADEMFFPVSYKGNHKRSKDFTMPRPAFKRGTDNHARTAPKACVMCALERNGQSYGEVLGLGQVSKSMAAYAFNDRVAPDSVVLSDSATAIKAFFAEKDAIELIQLRSTADGSRHSKVPEVRGALHIQTVNNYHNRMRRFFRKYNGVSTKYLNHYVNLFVWIENHKYAATQLDVPMKEQIINWNAYVPACTLIGRPSLPSAA